MDDGLVQGAPLGIGPDAVVGLCRGEGDAVSVGKASGLAASRLQSVGPFSACPRGR